MEPTRNLTDLPTDVKVNIFKQAGTFYPVRVSQQQQYEAARSQMREQINVQLERIKETQSSINRAYRLYMAAEDNGDISQMEAQMNVVNEFGDKLPGQQERLYNYHTSLSQITSRREDLLRLHFAVFTRN